MVRLWKFLSLLLVLGLACGVSAQRNKSNSTSSSSSSFESSTFSGLKFRSVGPALTSGRIIDLAVNPERPQEYYVAVASGGVWKTSNAGTTYKPIFDSQGSYSIGCVTLDPNNPHVVWVGTGENNGQRSVGYGDGVYRSADGGKSWKHMGLKQSEHIGKILVDPRDSKVIYVAAQGPLWSAGGDRGLYKSTDGGTTWNAVLTVSEHTGVSDIAFDPRNPDVIYATTWQRRRHVWTFISGGPESGVHKSEDGGKTWTQLKGGLPSGEVGRIALAVSPVNPDVVYAIAQASGKKGGFFRSTDRGASWSKQNDYQTSGNYYQEIMCDPKNVDRVYAMDTWGHVTHDGGKTWKKIGEKTKHVDNHALWIDPSNTDHLLYGCDGGLYETWDRTKTWDFKSNLPVTQFYKVAVDNAEPFYNIYGGTQDNFSLGGPARTTSGNGISNADWFITNGGDGFESAIDPKDPNIVYAQSQYGWLVRYDKKSGERTGIKPQPGKGEPAYRWNWDAPLVISPHSNTRLYFAANKLFRSDDRGNTWKTISPDLSRQLDRNTLPVMGRVWSVDAVEKNKSTSIYGQIVALDESPLKEGLLYVGTDDGLVHVSQDGGANWLKLGGAPGVPARTYVNQLVASQHGEQTVYAAFNNHKNGDFKPYLFKSTDAGQSWTKITNGLPERGSVYCVAEDHVDPNLLFCGTEFGCFFSSDGGKNWTQLKAGLPTVAIRDMAIQKRENDLVLASFGRGFYVLDNYAPLRGLTPQTLEKEAHLFAIKDPLMFIESRPLGLRGKAFQGDSYFNTPNPEVGATITYFLKEAPKTRKEKRQKEEKELAKSGADTPYPTKEEMRMEDREEKPYVLVAIKDRNGEVIRQMKSKPKKGINRVTWDFRYPTATPTKLKSRPTTNPFSSRNVGYLAMPGQYSATVYLSVDGKLTEITEPQSFEAKVLQNNSLGPVDQKGQLDFRKKVAELQRVVQGTNRYFGDLENRVKHLKVAVMSTPGAGTGMLEDLSKMQQRMKEMRQTLYGDRTLSSREFETAPSLNGRVGLAVSNVWRSSSGPTKTAMENYRIASEELGPLLDDLKTLANSIDGYEKKLEAQGAPYTPGRIPVWKGN